MGNLIKGLIPTRWYLPLYRKHLDFWHPVAHRAQRFYHHLIYLTPKELREFKEEDKYYYEYYLPRRHFFPRKNESPLYYPSLDSKYLETIDGEVRVKPRAIWKYLVAGNDQWVYWLTICPLTITMLTIGIMTFVKAGMNCGGILEFNTEQCAADMNMTYSEYIDFRSNGGQYEYGTITLTEKE